MKANRHQTFCCAVLLLCPAASQAQPLAITDESNSRIFSLNPDTGQSTFIGSTGVASLRDLARGLDGSLFASSWTTLYGINPGTGTATAVGLFGSATNMVGLEFSASGELFGVSASGGVYRVNTMTGDATLLFDAPFSFEGDLAHESGSDFYATVSAGAGSRLVALNTANMSATDRGMIAAGVDFPGLDFATDGRLLAFSRTGGVFHIPGFVSTAGGVFVSATSLPISGVTLTPIPEPSALVLASAFGGWLARGWFSRRRRTFG
jgi:hypothetical protein